MKIIETTVQVAPSGVFTIHDKLDLPPGKYRVVVVANETPEPEEPRPPLDLPVLDVGPWPEDLSLRREDMYDDWGR